MAKRDDTLRALLPPVDSPYSFDNLSEAETKALEEALGDGFGDRDTGIKPLPLPETIKSGLLEYSYFDRGSKNGQIFCVRQLTQRFGPRKGILSH